MDFSTGLRIHVNCGHNGEMDVVRMQRVSELFEAARHQPEDSREDYLREACDDEHLRSEVASLLRHHSDNRAPLDAPLLNDASAAALLSQNQVVRPLRVERIGQYHVIRLLGEGGMGTVYLAEQDRPRRTVALKVIRTGIATRKMLRRFEFEAAVLGMLNHPGIAQIYEAGVHDDGNGLRPYFAMEYVQGRTLTAYASETTLNTRQRLELVAKVCDAVQHAHQRGIIHRDLKPGNILVDDAGQPKVLDFGVARATDSDLQITTIQTDIGQLVGTLPYMSPEQVSGNVENLDTRSDVYSLGVILYELLSGRLPHDVRGKTIAEAARVIGEQEPTPLSSASRVFRGDLQTIVSRALDRNVERRYVSAAALADDLQRFLRDEPIEAKRDSVSYVLRRQLRRYRMAVAAGLVFALGTTLFAAYAVVQAKQQADLAYRERDARERAEDAGRAALEAERVAALERDDARRARDAESLRSKQAQAATAFLVNTLGIANPDVAQSADFTKELMLARAAADVNHAFPGQAEAEATVRAVIGKAYAALGEPEPATLHLWRALRLMRDFPQRDLEAEYELFWPYVQMLSDMRDPSAQRQRRDMRSLATVLLVDRVPELQQPLTALYDNLDNRFNGHEAKRLLVEIMSIAHDHLQPDESQWTILADVLQQSSHRFRMAEMRPTAHEVLAASLAIYRRMLGETNTRVVRLLSDLIDNRLAADDPIEAAKLAEQSLEVLSRVLPENHWYHAQMRFRLGECLAAQGRAAEAQALMLESIDRIIDSRGIHSDASSTALRTLVRFFDDGEHPSELAHWRMRFAESRAGGIQPLTTALSAEILGPENKELESAIRRVQAAVPRDVENLPRLVDELIEIWHAQLSMDDPRSTLVADFFTGMAERLMNQRGLLAYDIARSMVEATAAFDQVNHIRHPRRRALTQWWIGRIAELQGQYAVGEPYARAAMRILETGPTERSGFLGVSQSLLGGCLFGQGRYEEAEPLLVAGFVGMHDELSPHDRNTIIGVNRLIDAYVEWGRRDQATHWRVKLIDLERTRPQTDTAALNLASWRIAVQPGLSVSAYAAALAGAKQASEALPNDAAIFNTLGVAQYRAGLLDEALLTLTESDASSEQDQYEDCGFLAMTLLAMKRYEEAQSMRQRFDLLSETIAANRRLEYDMIAAELEKAFASHASPRATGN